MAGPAPRAGCWIRALVGCRSREGWFEQRDGAALPALLFLMALAVGEASLGEASSRLVRATAAAGRQIGMWHGGKLQMKSFVHLSELSLSARFSPRDAWQWVGRAVPFRRDAEQLSAVMGEQVVQ